MAPPLFAQLMSALLCVASVVLLIMYANEVAEMVTALLGFLLGTGGTLLWASKSMWLPLLTGEKEKPPRKTRADVINERGTSSPL
jgi:hypothetical protein